jgi:hypothetical protein
MVSGIHWGSWDESPMDKGGNYNQSQGALEVKDPTLGFLTWGTYSARQMNLKIDGISKELQKKPCL